MPPECKLRCRGEISRISSLKDTYIPPPVTGSNTASKASRYLLGLASLALSTTYFYSARYSSPTEFRGSNYALCSPDGANIYTVDPERPHVQCFVVQDGHFVDAGSLPVSDANVNATEISRVPVRFIPAGAIIVPGITDSHAHILEYGFTKVLPLEGTHTARETVGRVREYIESKPDLLHDKTKIVEGWGWDHTKWLQTTWPSSADLESDPIVAGRPIILQSKDGHALWISQKILTAMQPLPDEVEGGVIVRDDLGNPTGVLLDNAQILANAHRPEPTHDQLALRFNLTVQDAVSHGLTSIHDAGFDPVSLEFFRRFVFSPSNPCTIRVYGMTHFNESSEYWGDRAQKIMGASSGRLNARSVKIFADGTYRSFTKLYEPYADNPATRGFMRIEPEVLNDDGWQVNVHAIGDRANGLVLDAFEAALKDANVTALRPRLEHAQILAEKDMARFGKLGVIASIQPTHATDDMWYAEDRLGPERIKSLYAFRSILDHGGRITLGSDMPVEGVPEQRMTRMEALKGMTLDPAYASFSDDTLGSISIGKRADYVVFSQDIMKTKVLATVIDGGVAYGSI
ncbi:amidohydrolase family-domain-containing protein [Irpex lacteus]|nr:amidohydrolase family-domain-containing protein [Irpex lacteus]